MRSLYMYLACSASNSIVQFGCVPCSVAFSWISMQVYSVSVGLLICILAYLSGILPAHFAPGVASWCFTCTYSECICTLAGPFCMSHTHLHVLHSFCSRLNGSACTVWLARQQSAGSVDMYLLCWHIAAFLIQGARELYPQ